MPGIARRARETPDATAIVAHPRRISYAEFDDRQRRLVGALRADRLKQGDRVAVLSSNRPEALEALVGVARAGIIPVPVNPLLTPPEINYVLEDSEARWLITDRPVEGVTLDNTVTLGDAYERLLNDARPAKLGEFTRAKPMHYTSGTTGMPKGVFVKPYDAKTSGRLSAEFRSLWGITPEDIHLVCSPLAHSAPLRYSLRTLEAGGIVIVQPKFDAEETLATIDLFGVTSTFMVPTHLERILALGPQALRRYDTSSMRLLAHAGAPTREETKREVLKLFPDGSVWELYGATEHPGIVRISTEEWLERPASVGRPNPGIELEIRGENRRLLPPGEVGRIWVGGPALERFVYWHDRFQTTKAWHGDQCTVRDLGALDEDGYLYLAGRSDDTIITGGINVYPQEVEAVLSSHPAVAEALVYGVDDEEWGQHVHAAIVVKQEMPFDVERLGAWLRERLAGYKCPREIQVVDALPRTATGKLKRTLE